MTNKLKQASTVNSQRRAKLEVIIVWIMKRIFLISASLFIGVTLSLIAIFFLFAFSSEYYDYFITNIVSIVISGFVLVGMFLPYSVFQIVLNVLDPYFPRIVRALNKKVNVSDSYMW